MTAIATEGAPATERMPIVIGGHVDHGKSTIVGRLLADTGSLPEGRLEAIRRQCERHARPFEYAFVLDALKDEQAQGITIDAARIFFRSARRQYMILDAPGHIEFLKNMITGASHASAALLVIDAHEGVRENSRRHGYMMSLLGIRQLAVLVNKMDLVGYGQAAFAAIAREYGEFLGRLGVQPTAVIPVSGREGDNLAARSPRMPWYDGPTVLEALDWFTAEPPPVDQAFRMPVQDVYKFTASGDDRRIVAGTITSGTLRVGDEVVFYPAGKRSRVRTIEAFNRPRQEAASAGMATGFTLEEQIYVARGELATLASGPRPAVSTRLRVSLFWLGLQPLVRRREYLLKLGSARVPVRIEAIHRVVDASDLSVEESRDEVRRHEVAECTLELKRAIALDSAEHLAATSRFVLVDDYEIRGGGIVREALPDRHAEIREKVMLRNMKWEPSIIPPEERAERYGQRSALLLVSGPSEAERKAVAKDLEARLFRDGRVVYYLGMAGLVYGVDADLSREADHRREHLRRLGEVANILLDAGAILIVTAQPLDRDDLEVIRTSVNPERIHGIWVGSGAEPPTPADLHVPSPEAHPDVVDLVKGYLQDKDVVFRPW